MNAERQARMEAKGDLVVDNAADWLGLDEVDRQVVEFRVRVGQEVRRRRAVAEMTQAQLAKSIGSSQSRIARVEATADGVGVDLLLRPFFALGGQLSDLAKLFVEDSSESQSTERKKRRKTSESV